MTKKHFEQIAKAMRNLRTFEAHDQEMSETVVHAVRFTSVVDALASVCAESNPRCDRGRFLQACGIGAQEPKPKKLSKKAAKLKAAQEAIDNEDVVCFDVAAEHGQIFSGPPLAVSADVPSESAGAVHLTDRRFYGDTGVSFYRSETGRS